MKFTLKYKDKLSDSPCIPLIMEAWNDLVKLHYVDPLIIFDEDVIGDHEVIWCEHKNSPVSLITFTHHPKDHYTWIRMTYVVDSFRHQQLYQKMYDKLRKLVIKKGIPRISGGIYEQNKPMQAAAAKVGRVIEYSVWSEFLK